MAEKKKRIPRPNAQKISDEQIMEIIEIMATDGLHFTGACERMGWGKMRRKIAERIAATDHLRAAEARARPEYLVHKVAEINDIVNSEPDPARARLKCDNIKWEAARVCRKLYGDRQEIEHSGPDGGPIATNIIVRFVDPRDTLIGACKEIED